ncbi:hypothetical protein LSH36_287g00036 [Paralvinella palmiformis]|uniref:Uncharacterized protein n=1 Tax=Paralvinella palmiformis TaxID=53620 RepID=A0AAD9N3K7_9ANNE|nr:hypothetical protein LSH36_287g00036 [Paralvinella palmiformis]
MKNIIKTSDMLPNLLWQNNTFYHMKCQIKIQYGEKRNMLSKFLNDYYYEKLHNSILLG